jgi:hypothetical protein
MRFLAQLGPSGGAGPEAEGIPVVRREVTGVTRFLQLERSALALFLPSGRVRTAPCGRGSMTTFHRLKPVLYY